MKDATEDLPTSSRRTLDSASSEPARTGLRAQGVRTRNAIIRAATKVLLDSAGFDFTLRAVARQAKISISNLQYYFPDRQSLLRAVMAPFIETYFTDLDGAVKRGISPQETLTVLVERQLRDVSDAKFRLLWWHFSQLACVDPECSQLFDEWFETLARGIASLIAKINPDLGAAGSLQLAMIVIAMGNGLSFQMQAGRESHFTRGLDDTYRQMVEFLLHSNPLLTRGRAPAKRSAK